jgi:transcription initiation factor TFIID subunit TAF12
MPNKQKEQQPPKGTFPTLPKVMEHRLSMKWLTMEALSKVNRLQSPTGTESRVMLLTPWGQVEGKMEPIASSYADSYRDQNGQLTPDYASMVAHIRTDLLSLIEQEDSQSQDQDQQKQAQGGQQSQSQGQQQQKQSQQDSGGQGGGKLELVDAAPLISLTDVVLRSGQNETRLPQLTLFADQIIGFTLLGTPQVH